MPSILKKSLLFFCLLLIEKTFSQTQNPDKQTHFKLFFEKVYLHTDKSFYLSGDNIWYKAYLVNAQSNYPTFSSNNLYVELISSNATLITKQVIRLDNAIGNGDFKIPDSLPTGTYLLRAYTNWMKNFGSDFVFEKRIEIKNKQSATIAKKITAPTNSRTEKIEFFPEGGSLIAGVQSVVAFKAETENGKSIDVKGSVINAKGETVASFKSSFSGMGSFVFTPKQDEFYEIKAVTANNHPLQAELPIALEKGFQLSVTDVDTSFVLATIKTNAATLSLLQNTNLIIAGKHGGRLVYEDSIKLNSQSVQLKIAKNNFPSGIAVITLYDNKLRPNCERLVFIEKTNQPDIFIQLNKPLFKPDERTSLNINLSQTQAAKEEAELSLAVVDAGLVSENNENIISYLLLQSEVKGFIENPKNYFDKNNNDRFKQLDLLLLTQGWREFLWTKLSQEKINLKYLPETGISITGTVKRSEAQNPLANMNITLFAPQAKGNKIYFTKTDSSGKYYLDGLNLVGTERIKLVSKDDKGKKGGYITMDSLFKNSLPVYAFTNITDSTAQPPLFEPKNIERLTKEDIKPLLPNVTVFADNNRPEYLRGDVMLKLGYKDSTFIINDLDDKKYGTLENYLHARMPGAYVDVENGGIYFMGERGAQVRPRIFVDNREDVFERLDYYNLPMSTISKIVIGRGLSAINNTPIYTVHLTVKQNIASLNEPELISTEIDGYYQARAFYLPPIKKNFQEENTYPTVYWLPNIKTTNGNANMDIYNKGGKSKYRIVVQGLTNTGTPVYSVANYEVK
jgi:hypothetical protein